jgi:hypothetical protein
MLTYSNSVDLLDKAVVDDARTLWCGPTNLPDPVNWPGT